MRCTICDRDTDLIEFDDQGTLVVDCSKCRTEVFEANNNLNLDNMRYTEYSTLDREEL